MQNTNQNQNQDQPDYSKMSFEELAATYDLTKGNNKDNTISALELALINQLFAKLVPNSPPQLPKEYIGDNLNVTIVVNSMLAAMLCNLPKELVIIGCRGNQQGYNYIAAIQQIGKLVNFYIQKQYGTTCPKVSVDNTGSGVDLTDPKSRLDRN